jgi:3-oxoacyl-[acyl-carrier protein] reductase
VQIDLTGKIAIVTGAGRGIGREIAETFAREGVTVIVTDIRQELLDDWLAAAEANGWTGRGHICDVRDSARIQAVVDETVRDFGRIDILVNNAGVAGGAYVDELSEDLWDANMDINLKGTFLMCKAVVPVMKRQKSGRILNAASFAAIVPSLGSSAYAASKAGVHYFTRVLAGEVGPYDITVNCYAPGMVPSEINHFTEQPADIQERLLDTLTLRRWQEAKDVASLLCFLASDHAGYITGTLVDVSGGKLATQIPRRAYQRAGVLE